MSYPHAVVLLDTQDGRPKHTVLTVLGPMSADDAAEIARQVNDADVGDVVYADNVALGEFTREDVGSLISELRGENDA
jgi:hypothetical protein